MAALLYLYFDTTTKQLASSIKGPVGIAMPRLRQEDGVSIRLTVIRRISTIAPPFFQVVNMSGYGLQLSVGVSAGTVLASQNSWDSQDAAGGWFEGTLPLNTSGINALSDNTQVWFEIRLFNGTYYYGARFRTFIEKAIATAGSPQAIAGDTALGSLEARRTYLPKEGGAGEGFILKSADGTKSGIIYWGDDNALHTESIT